MADKPEENDEKADGEVPLEDPKGFPVKKILLIAIPLLLLGGGGAGAYFTGMLDGLLGKKPAAANAHGEAAQAAAGGHGESGGEHGGGGEHGEGGGGGPVFLKVADEKGQDLVVNLSGPDGRAQLLQLGVQLELSSPGDVDRVKAVMPRVIDQFQTYLRELRPKDLRGSAGIYRLQMELLARVNQAAAPVQVKDVLFEKILIQ